MEGHKEHEPGQEPCTAPAKTHALFESAAVSTPHIAQEHGETSATRKHEFSADLGSLAHTAIDGSPGGDSRVNIMRLDDLDEDGEIQEEAMVELGAPFASASLLPPKRQGVPNLTRRGQSYPAASLLSTEQIEAINSITMQAPEFRDTYTPDIQSQVWHQDSVDGAPLASSPAKSHTSPLRRSAQLGGMKSPAKRWDLVRATVHGRSKGNTFADAAEATMEIIRQRQDELKGSMQIDPGIKQALYDNMGRRKQKDNSLQQNFMDLEDVVIQNVQKFIRNTMAFVKGSRAKTPLSVKSGWVESKRKGLFGSKTVRQYVQLCVDGSFIMRKTEQPDSPIITSVNVKDIDIEEDAVCMLTINLVPLDMRHLAPTQTPSQRSPFLRREGSFRKRVTSFKVNDAVSKASWLQAFAARKHMAHNNVLKTMNVSSILSELKKGTQAGSSSSTSGWARDALAARRDSRRGE